MSIGESPIRVDATAKLAGTARYPADRVPTDALHAATVFTNQPHARLVAIDLEAARAVPGVVAVYGSADIPVNEYGLTLFDQPVFVGIEHTNRSHIPCDVSRWEADHVALVVAETVEAAYRGAAAITTEWEQLAIVTDLDDALSDE
ncbi:MAG: aldehyde oxidase, partial [Actinomycetota bacterium]|nr:aldehyde oxidase [Actinomycetota bacterium]